MDWVCGHSIRDKLLHWLEYCWSINKSPFENNEITQHYTYAARSNYHSSMEQAVLLPPFRLVFLTRVRSIVYNSQNQ